MVDIKKLIEAAIEKKPLDIKEMINEIMTEKVRGVVTETVHGFEYEDELTEEEELAAFFEEFHAEYGHLTEEEQFAIMEEISEEDELAAFFEEFHAEYGHLTEEEQLAIMEELEEGCCSKCDCDPCECGNKGKGKKSSGAGMSPAAMAKAVRANPSQDPVTKEEFFAAFQEEYGHLPLDEQEEIMANLAEGEPDEKTQERLRSSIRMKKTGIKQSGAKWIVTHNDGKKTSHSSEAAARRARIDWNK